MDSFWKGASSSHPCVLFEVVFHLVEARLGFPAVSGQVWADHIRYGLDGLDGLDIFLAFQHISSPKITWFSPNILGSPSVSRCEVGGWIKARSPKRNRKKKWPRPTRNGHCNGRSPWLQEKWVVSLMITEDGTCCKLSLDWKSKIFRLILPCFEKPKKLKS